MRQYLITVMLLVLHGLLLLGAAESFYFAVFARDSSSLTLIDKLFFLCLRVYGLFISALLLIRFKQSNLGLMFGLLLSTCSCLLGLYMAESILQSMGYPSELRERVVHPANFLEVREGPEFGVNFRTDAMGLRAPTRGTEPTSKDLPRMLILGDSFVEGWGVEYEESFPAILDEKFTELKVINAGIATSAPHRSFQVFRYLETELTPQCVLLAVYANDLFEMPSRQDFLPGVRDDISREGVHRLLHRAFPRFVVLLEYAFFKSMQSERRKTLRGASLLSAIRDRALRENVPVERLKAWDKAAKKVSGK